MFTLNYIYYPAIIPNAELLGKRGDAQKVSCDQVSVLVHALQSFMFYTSVNFQEELAFF